MDRDALYQRIDARVDSMIDAGLLDEVQRLLDTVAGFDLSLSKARTASRHTPYTPECLKQDPKRHGSTCWLQPGQNGTA